MDLNNKVALITGAAKRIGQALALALAEQGCHIILHYGRSETAAKETAAMIEAQGSEVWLVSADLAVEAAVNQLIPFALEGASRLDILVNSASIFVPEYFADASSDLWDRTMMINLKAPFLLSQAFAQALPEDRQGKIINLLDTDSDRPRNHHFAYTISKVGLRGLNQAMAHALAERNIQVNGIALGHVLPNINTNDQTEFEKGGQRVPAKRTGSPQDVIQAMLYFLQGANYVTGEVIRVDGGKHLA